MKRKPPLVELSIPGTLFSHDAAEVFDIMRGAIEDLVDQINSPEFMEEVRRRLDDEKR